MIRFRDVEHTKWNEYLLYETKGKVRTCKSSLKLNLIIEYKLWILNFQNNFEKWTFLIRFQDGSRFPQVYWVYIYSFSV